jgi:hypothetical protein
MGNRTAMGAAGGKVGGVHAAQQFPDLALFQAMDAAYDAVAGDAREQASRASRKAELAPSWVSSASRSLTSPLLSWAIVRRGMALTMTVLPPKGSSSKPMRASSLAKRLAVSASLKESSRVSGKSRRWDSTPPVSNWPRNFWKATRSLAACWSMITS